MRSRAHRWGHRQLLAEGCGCAAPTAVSLGDEVVREGQPTDNTPMRLFWLPGQVSGYLKTPRLRELCATMQEPIPELIGLTP